MTSEAQITAPTKPNRMERRRQETRNKLLSATVKLVIKKGIDKTTLDDITEAADLGRRTFYYHFAGKDECIQAAAAAIYHRHGEFIDLRTDSDDDGYIVALSVQVVLDEVLREPITGCLLDRPRLLGGAFMDALGDFMRRDIARGIEKGTFQPAVDIEVLKNVITWSIVGLIIETQGMPGSRSDVLRDYAQTFLMILGMPLDQAKEAADRAQRSLAA